MTGNHNRLAADRTP